MTTTKPVVRPMVERGPMQGRADGPGHGRIGEPKAGPTMRPTRASTSGATDGSDTADAPTSGPIHIGEAASRSGVSAKMVRHYESLGLLGRVARSDSGYRRYSEREVHTLRFIRRARDLGFSIAEIAELVKLWQNRRRASGDVKRIALAHVADLERRIDAMTAMKRTLEGLAACCHGDGRPECPILEELSDDGHHD